MNQDLNTLQVGDAAVIGHYGAIDLPNYTRVIVKRKTKTLLIVGYVHITEIEKKFRIQDGKEHAGYCSSNRLESITQGVIDNELRRELEKKAWPVLQLLNDKLLQLLNDKLGNIRWLTNAQIHILVNVTNELFAEKKEDQVEG